jgi:solute carrier family 25 (mitochondrial uncoupling protein), member 8/9
MSGLLNPNDVVKVRLQNQRELKGADPHARTYRGFGHALRTIAREEGVLSLWTYGLAPSLMRDLTYSSIRLGMATEVAHALAGSDSSVSTTARFAAGLITGGVGSALCNPFDVVKLRLQRYCGRVSADGSTFLTGLHSGEAVPYRGTWHAFATIAREEGVVAGFYRGASVTAVRAALLTAGQVSSYSWCKHFLKEHGGMREGFPLHSLSAVLSGVVAVTLSQPADTVKSRLLSAKDAHSPFRGGLDCLLQTVRHEGPHVLFRGWSASFLRIGPHFSLSLPLLEVFRRYLGLDYFD